MMCGVTGFQAAGLHQPSLCTCTDLLIFVQLLKYFPMRCMLENINAIEEIGTQKYTLWEVLIGNTRNKK